MKRKMSLRAFSIVLGVMVVIVSIVWVTMISLCRADKAGNEVTWVG